MIGRRFGGAVVVRLIGRGGMGAVYEAENPLIRKRYAIKVVLPELGNSKAAVDRFFQEARAAAEVSHPRLVPIIDCGFTDDGRPFQVMPFLEGQDLDAFCLEVGEKEGHARRLELSTAAPLFFQCLDGLAAAHDCQIVHRDLKGANLFVERDRTVKILDFGIAKLFDPSRRVVRTETHQIIGTPGYMPPEQVRGRQVDYRTDLWALGAVFFRCLTGRLPFEGEDVVELAAKAMYAPPPRATELVPEVPIAVSEVLVSCLAADPDGRPDSARMMAHALAAAVPGGREIAEKIAPTLLQRSGPSDTTIRPTRAQPRPTVPGRRGRTVTLPPGAAAAIAARTEAGLRADAALLEVETRPAQTSAESTLLVRRIRWWPWPRPVRLTVLVGLATAGAIAAIATRTVARDDRVASTPAAVRASLGPAATDASPASPHRAAGHYVPAAPLGSLSSTSRSLESAGSDPAMARSAALAGPAAPDDDETRTPEQASSRARAESGTLVITVYPAADVWLDGKPAGSAPLTQALPAGRHRVKLLGPHEKSETLRVLIRAGQTTRIDRKWSQE